MRTRDIQDSFDRTLAEIRAGARRWRWSMEVQREALGLRSHRDLDRFHALPPAVHE